MFLRRCALLKYFLAALAGALVYNEWVIYEIQPWFWNDFQCPAYDISCTKILFVADPQIQGETEVSPPLNYLFNWDSDQYLKSTFSVAMRYHVPDVLVFMGDLMDEGSIATKEQYQRYVTRLQNIFRVSYQVITVWLPGDNDIGGENEPIRKDKVKAFDETFKQPDSIMFRNISFIKVNAILHSVPKIDEVHKHANLSIVLSHYPVTIRKTYNEMISKEISPDIYFSAHSHESKYVVQNSVLRETKPYDYGSPVLNITFGRRRTMKYEIEVPTCSYRMGTRKIGYGAAIVEYNNQRLRYTVFWSPERFPYLVIYLILFIFFVVYFGVFFTTKLIIRRRDISLSDMTVPLLKA